MVVKKAGIGARVTVQGEGAANMARTLAKPENRLLLQSLKGRAQQVAAHGKLSDIGDAVGKDVNKALGADQVLPTKYGGNNGIDVASKGPKRVIMNEVKTGEEFTLRTSKQRPAPHVTQGTPDYNNAQLRKMAQSSDPALRNSAKTLDAANDRLHLATHLTNSGDLRIVNGNTLQDAIANSGKAVAPGGRGVIRPAMTSGEKVRVGAASAVPTSQAGHAAGATKRSSVHRRGGPQ